MSRLVRFLRPYRAHVAIVFLLVFLQSMTELYLPTLMAEIVDRGVVRQDTRLILRVGGWMLLVTAVGTAGAVIGSYIAAKMSSGFGRDLRARIFSRVTDFSLHEFDQIGTASLITRTTNDVTQVQQVLFMMTRVMMRAPFMIVGGVIMALSQDTTLSWVIVVVIPILGALIGIVSAKGAPLFRAIQVKLDKVSLIVREGLTGVRVVRAFHRIDHERRRFTEASEDLMETAIRVGRIMSVMMPSLMLILNLTTVAIIWFGGVRIDQGQMQVGSLMAFIQYVMQIMWALLMMTMMFVMVPRAAASAARINEVLETVTDIQDPQGSAALAAVSPPDGAGATSRGGELAASDGRRSLPPRGVLQFHDVTFRYPGAERPAIANLSFKTGPGEVTAVIGGIGSGKSTLANLIPRFYDVTEGKITLDGVDIRELTQEELRRRIGYVAQRAFLFGGTIADNIRFGKEEATDEEVRHAAKVAQAHEFISEMPDGYQSVVAQGGTNLSGGQKQRLTIARALVRRPDIYIFDDNFSALDLKTEARLRAALQEEIKLATVLIIAQRVSTIMGADRIIVLDEGRVAGIGTHQELLAHCDVYREIVASQLSEEAIA